MPGPDAFAPGAVVVGSLFPELSDATDDLGARWSKLTDPRTQWSLRLLSADETGDGRVVVLALASRRTSEGHGWTQLVAGIYEFRDGLIIRAEGRQDPFALYRELGLTMPDLSVGDPVGADHATA